MLLAVETRRRRRRVGECLARGLLVGTAGEHALRLTPPLTFTDEELEHGLSILEEVLAVSKFDRQGAILRLVSEQKLGTQAELAEALRERGLDAVQTTVSRDIAQLGLVKVRDEDGRLVYALPGAADLDRLDELTSALRRLRARRCRRPATCSSSTRRPGTPTRSRARSTLRRSRDVAGTVAATTRSSSRRGTA